MNVLKLMADITVRYVYFVSNNNSRHFLTIFIVFREHENCFHADIVPDPVVLVQLPCLTNIWMLVLQDLEIIMKYMMHCIKLQFSVYVLHFTDLWHLYNVGTSFMK